MKSVFEKKEDCCGCTACQHICTTKAIDMVPDEEGFLYPLINQNFCVDCGFCKKICAFSNGYDKSGNFIQPKVYAIKHIDDNIRMNSTSGGAFTAISDYILENNGVVYGAAFDENMNVIHQIAKNEEERNALRGSKYVQSDLKSTYSEIKVLLTNNKLVLFTGTPCQTAGLRSYLGDLNTENLILCDIVCHGTPSPLMWREHIKRLEKKENSKMIEYHFRSKIKGWHNHIEMAIYENGRISYKDDLTQEHRALFYSHNILRPSCHVCKYTNLQRPSDITIADFWGIEKVMPDFDDNKGISLILVNTIRGDKLFKNINNRLIYRESNAIDCISMQAQLQHPPKPCKSRNVFWKDYHLKGYEFVVKKYGGFSLKSRAKNCTKLALRKFGLYKKLK